MQSANSCRSCPHPRGRGFTLIEVLITIAILAIVASLAFPSFMGAVKKSRRSEALAALNQVQQAQERFRANNAQYTTNLTAAPSASPPGLGLPNSTPNGFYTIAIVSAGASSYEVTATANTGSSQVSDADCAKLGVRINNAVLEYASGGVSATLTYSPTNACWGR